MNISLLLSLLLFRNLNVPREDSQWEYIYLTSGKQGELESLDDSYRLQKSGTFPPQH